MELKHLTNTTLLIDTKKHVEDERKISLKVLHHLKEIERRRLFADMGFGSLFEYAVRDLGYSEPSANRRIQAARMLREMPFIEEKIADGRLSLTNLVMANQLFKNEDINNIGVKKQILERIENTTKKECENELIKFATIEPSPSEGTKQYNEGVHALRMNISQSTLELLDEVKGVLAHKRPSNDQLMNQVLRVALKVLKDQKFKTNAKLTTPAALPRTGRYIPAMIKKKVYERDQGKCRNCRSAFKVEFDHILPFAQGGSSTAENLRLLCFSCNQRRNKV